MATAPNPVKPAAAKYDAFVETQLRRAQQRIRWLDTGSALLSLLAFTLLFAIAMTIADHGLDLTPVARLAVLLVYAGAALAWLAVGVVRPWLRRVNPYYAALQVEHSLPDAKNSVVNWLDLHDRPLPGAIRQAVVQRAAQDIGHADLEEAINGGRVLILGGVVGGLFVAAFIAMVWLGPPQFFSRLARVFAPFGEGHVATHTQLTVVLPEGGSATVPAGRAVQFLVQIEGRVPERHQADALKLCYRFSPEEKGFQERLLERQTDSEWVTSLSDTEIQDGFWYKIQGGDVETPEYHVVVRPGPIAVPVRAVYDYRPYVRPNRQIVLKPTELEALRGTRVTLEASANYPVREAQLELELGAHKEVVAGVVNPTTPETMTFQFVLDQDGKQPMQSGKYWMNFTTPKGESNREPTHYDVRVRRDEVPVVTLDKPEADLTLPANGLLTVLGRATDDFGVKDLRLQMQVVNGPRLHPQVYRPEKAFRREDGGYPEGLAYRDAVELGKATDAEGKPFTLRPKMEVEFWLEATDACDYPEPLQGQTGASAHRKVKIAEPAPTARQEKARQENAQRQQEHNQRQDQQLKQEAQARRQNGANSSPQSKKQPGGGGGADNQQEQQPKPGSQDGSGDQPQKPEDQPRKGENQPGAQTKPGASSENKSDPAGGSEKSGDGGQKQDADPSQPDGNKSGSGADARLDQKIQEAIDRKPSADRSNDGKPQEGENKPEGDPGAQPNKADGKGNSERQSRPDAAQAKGSGGGAASEQPKPGEGKEPGPADGSSGAGKAPPSQAGDAGQGKSEGKPEQPPEKAQGKEQGHGGEAGQPAENKEGARGPSDGDPDRAKGKEQGPGSSQSSKGAGEAKGNPAPDKGAAKPTGGEQPGTGDAPATAKKEGAAKDEVPEKIGQPKPAGSEKGTGDQKARAEGKGDGQKAPPRPSSGQDPDHKEARDLRNQLQQEKPLTRDELERKLQELSEKSADPRVRDAAQKALDDLHKEPPDGAPGSPATPPPPAPKEAGSGAAKAGDGARGGAPKPNPGTGPGAGEPGTAKKEGKPGEGSSAGEKGTPDPNQQPGSARGSGGSGRGTEPGNGNSGNGVPGSGAGPGTGKGSAPQAEPDHPDAHQEAGNLQLEQFRTWVDRDVLKALHMTPEQFQAYLQAKKKSLTATPPRNDRADQPKAIQRTGTLPDFQSDREQGGTQAGSSTGRAPGEAPPGFREGDREYAERRANLRKKPSTP